MPGVLLDVLTYLVWLAVAGTLVGLAVFLPLVLLGTLVGRLLRRVVARHPDPDRFYNEL